MRIAEVKVALTTCKTTRLVPIPKGIVGATVFIEYTDSAWDGLQKTVVFRSAVTKDVLDSGNEVTIPAEVVSRAGVNLYMGVYGVGEDGRMIIPTIWAELGQVNGAAAPSGDSSTDPSLPVWAQIQTAIGNLDDLDTDVKSNLVAAVNEALTKGGGEVDPASVQKIVDDYLKANPPSGGTDISLGLTSAAVGQTVKVKAVDADGKPTEWETETPESTAPTDEQVSSAVSSYLNAHPEATTTVQDGAVTPQKTSFLRVNYHNILDWDAPGVQNGYFFYSGSSAAVTGGGTAAYSVSDYIPVAAGQIYSFGNIRAIKWLDAEKAYLATNFASSQSLISFTAPENAAYMRIDVDAAKKATSYLYQYAGKDYEYSDYATDYDIFPKDEAYEEMLLRSAAETWKDASLVANIPDGALQWPQIKGMETFHWNIIDPAKCRFGITIDAATGAEKLFSNSTLYSLVSDYAPVSAGEILLGGNYGWYCYDSEKQYIAKLTWASGKVVIPENGCYIRVVASGYLTNAASAKIIALRDKYGKYFKYTDVYSYDNEFPVFQNEDCLNGYRAYLGIRRRVDKKIAVIGDSFTAPSTWVNLMCDNLGAQKQKNCAVSGGAFSKYDGVPKTAYEQAQELAADGAVPDIILVVLGTNDCNNSRTIGDIVYENDISSFDLTTFSGGMQACINLLMNSFPESKIYVGWTPMGGLYSTAHDPAPYIARMQSICMAYGIQYIETRTCGVSPLVTANAECFESGTSGGHPTDAGQQRIGEYMTQMMECTP